MDAVIRQKMHKVCNERNLIPLVGIERGSRMIGVSHENSDWDAFLLFAQRPSAYVTLGGYTDTVSRKFEVDGEEIDIHGWNIKKFAELAADSNPSAAEFCMSAHRYFNYTPYNLDMLAKEMRMNFNHMSLYHHYLSLATNNYKKYIETGNDCTYNRQFYVLRATLMARHIRLQGSFPRLDVWEFLDQTECLTDEQRSLMASLANKKQNGKLGEAENLVGQHLAEEKAAEMVATDERINSPRKDILNQFIEAALY